jgi:rfaE bifunctional protein nucleotidyltransferase chain/domain
MNLPAPKFLEKIAQLDEAVERASRLTRPLVFTNGVFDILHCGHVAYLDQARQLGASLVVAVNTDESARRLQKGEDEKTPRPLNNVQDRMRVLAALESVALVVPFDEDTPLELIEKILPDVLVKGGDYSESTAAGAKEVIANGGKFVSIPFLYHRSTTALVKKILGTNG